MKHVICIQLFHSVINHSSYIGALSFYIYYHVKTSKCHSLTESNTRNKLQAILRQLCWMSPNLTITLQGQRYPQYGYSYSRIPNFTRFSLWPPRQFWNEYRPVHWMTPKWPWTLKGQRYPIQILHYYPQVPNFTPYCFTASCFRVIGHIETSAQNSPQMILNTKRYQGTIYMLKKPVYNLPLQIICRKYWGKNYWKIAYPCR